MIRFFKFLVGLLLLLLVTGAIYFFLFQNGVSYFANKPEACLNCHVMQEPFDAWTKSTHHTTAACNDCHLSRGSVAKTLEKIKNGFNHSKAFVLKTYKEPLTIHSESQQIVQANCVRCHSETTKANESHQGMNATTNCLTCHARAGHQTGE